MDEYYNQGRFAGADLSQGSRDDPTPRITGRHRDSRGVRDYRMPYDLTRSRRVGLEILACAECSMTKNESFCAHGRRCSAPDVWIEWTTGPMGPDETSLDTGWTMR